MKKTIFAFATLALFTLEAAQFQVKTSITPSSADAQTSEYLVKVQIDQTNDGSAPIEFAKPTILCQLGTEGEVKFIGEKGDGYTVKALVYQAEEAIKLKTSVTILDAEKKEIFHTDGEEVIVR